MTRVTPASFLVALLAGAAPIVATFAPVQLTSLFVATALPLVIIARKRLNRTLLMCLGGVLLGLILWGATSVIWSAAPDETAKRISRLPILFALGALALAAVERTDLLTRQTALKALHVSILGTIGVLILLHLGEALGARVLAIASDSRQADNVNYYKVGGTCLAALTLVLATHFIDCGKYYRAGVIALLAGGAIVTTESTTALLAYMVALAVLCTAALGPRIAGALIAGGAVTIVLVAPWSPEAPIAVLERLSSSGLHRISIWQFTIERIHEAPWLGWGLDTARALPGADAIVPSDYLGASVQQLPQWYALMQLGAAEFIPLHPHNNPLQVWLELGLPGALLFAALYGGAAIAVGHNRSQSRTRKAGLLAVLAFMFVVSNSSFGVWQSWWVSLQFTTWAIAIAVLWRPATSPLVTAREPAGPPLSGSPITPSRV